MPELRLSVEPDAPQSSRWEVIQGLLAFNAEHFPITRVPPMTILLRDSADQIRGGLLGEVFWNWLHVNALWVHDSHRGAGWGSRLLSAAEEEAIGLGCHSAHLNTYAFQARPFYERHGYRVFGELPDCPMGHTRYFLYKRLTASAPTPLAGQAAP